MRVRTFSSALKQAGENVYERVVEFPLWEEYGESIKSEIADMKNLEHGRVGAISCRQVPRKIC